MKIEKGKDILVGNRLTKTSYGLKGSVYFLIRKSKIKGKQVHFYKNIIVELSQNFSVKYMDVKPENASELNDCITYLNSKGFNPEDFSCIKIDLKAYITRGDMSDIIRDSVERVETLMYLQLII